MAESVVPVAAVLADMTHRLPLEEDAAGADFGPPDTGAENLGLALNPMDAKISSSGGLVVRFGLAGATGFFFPKDVIRCGIGTAAEVGIGCAVAGEDIIGIGAEAGGLAAGFGFAFCCFDIKLIPDLTGAALPELELRLFEVEDGKVSPPLLGAGATGLLEDPRGEAVLLPYDTGSLISMDVLRLCTTSSF